MMPLPPGRASSAPVLARGAIVWLCLAPLSAAGSPGSVVETPAVADIAIPAAGALDNVDVLRPPFDAVGLVTNSVGGRCTGVLVAEDVAITAAHCLYNARTKRFVRPQSVHFLLGFDRGEYRFHARAAQVFRSPAYDPEASTPSFTEDWAVLQFASKAPATIAPMAVAPLVQLDEDGGGKAREVFATGFARQRSEVMTRTASCEVHGPPSDDVIVSSCAASPGLSGGPLIDAATGALVAIQIGTAIRDGQPVTISLSARSIMEKWRALAVPR